MDDDFNTPVAISVIFEFAKALNGALDRPEGLSPEDAAGALAYLETYAGKVLGILKSRDELLAKEGGDVAEKFDMLLNLINEIRIDFRAEKNFKKSDEIRDKLKAIGIVVSDTSSSSRGVTIIAKDKDS
jgi:cysteinyl-tRNA synthetase